MRFGQSLLALLACLSFGGLSSQSRAEDARYGAGAKLDSLTVGATTYRQVQVRSVGTRTVTIIHAGGMASIHLRDLSPEWQARFHYDPAAEVAAGRVSAVPAAAVRPIRPTVLLNEATFARLLREFGAPVLILPEVDLRPKFTQLELGVKNQGRRPSCAIFAIVSALEFQNAEATAQVQKFSEEYLSWATRKIVHRTPLTPSAGSDDPAAAAEQDDDDEGFSLGEVVDALRGYGIPLQSSMPNTFGRAIQTIQEPSPTVVAEARSHQKVFIHLVPGRDNATRINNLIHALNAGVPVVVGMGWPNYRTMRGGYLSGQKPMLGRGHAVTLVGYTSKSSQQEDVVFIFKNSWGVEWGQGGYGMVSYHYLNNYLGDAVLLEVQPG